MATNTTCDDSKQDKPYNINNNNNQHTNTLHTGPLGRRFQAFAKGILGARAQPDGLDSSPKQEGRVLETMEGKGCLDAIDEERKVRRRERSDNTQALHTSVTHDVTLA